MKRLLLSITTCIILLSTHTISLADWFLPQTGQTACYNSSGDFIACTGSGQDGELRTGAVWPNPRFTGNNNGAVTDNLTGLVWLKNANCFSKQNWSTALTSAKTLATNICGLTDGSSAGQWRLPSIIELESLWHEEPGNPPNKWLINGFTAVQQGYQDYYWSASTNTGSTGNAWSVNMSMGLVASHAKSGSYYVWPVRGGQ